MTVSHAAEDAILGGERITDGLWTHKGKLQVRGDVVLPAGVIDTSELAVGAASALIGSYAAAATFSTTVVGSALATPVTTGSIACSGTRVRIFCSGAASHTVAGALISLGLMTDGVGGATLVALNVPGVNYLVPFAWELMVTPAAGNHTFTLFLLSSTAGTASLNAGIASVLYATEEKR